MSKNAKKEVNESLFLLEFESSLEPLYSKLEASKSQDKGEVRKEIDAKLKKIYSHLSFWQNTLVARHPARPYARDYIGLILKDAMYLSGDRLGFDDKCTVGAIGSIGGRSVLVVGQQKGRSVEENILYNFGMPKPEGYRKALRLFQFAEKFDKPIVTLIDTPGAYPGIEGEERSQSEAIARNLREMGGVGVPIISLVIGEGGSGGALGIGVANHIMMLKHSIYSVISPESCASILWKDPLKKEIGANLLKNDAKTAKELGIIDEIIDEGIGGAHRNWKLTAENVERSLIKILDHYSKMSSSEIISHRMEKFAKMGSYTVVQET